MRNTKIQNSVPVKMRSPSNETHLKSFLVSNEESSKTNDNTDNTSTVEPVEITTREHDVEENPPTPPITADLDHVEDV